MRVDEFKKHLAHATAAPAEPPCSAENEIFVVYQELPNFGVPRYSRVHLRRLIAKGLFPSPAMLSANRIAWRLSALESWKASRPDCPVSAAAAA